MTPVTCSFCGFHHVVGYMFNRHNLGICKSCRDFFLTGLYTQGIVMSASHPLIRELCEHTHFLESEWYRYYNSITGTVEVVIRNKK